ncbi:DUF3889 domain-containing protein [Paenibacillus sp. J22TS3]|uniref:DUF3889 domain-containing protein n=1 Tax=Paenibacillus sp. J22TS3 TaxID=2807192 RepID=UPI001B2AEBA9|nr:DUF3889 domain-containing protein [Paenibacillus sp. J22TS3]GIP21010.1 hypothetical protein J22TS3_12850 [Paenibacillus sp. J22TS3]
MQSARRWVVTLIAGLLLSAGVTVWGTHHAQAEPSYAEWGRVAVLEAKKKYNAEITDYKHIGRKTLRDHVYEEKFKLIVKKPLEEFGVYVNVRFNEDTGELLNISYKEAGNHQE